MNVVTIKDQTNRFAAVLVILTGLVSCAVAQDAGTNQIRLQAAVDLALVNDPLAKVSDAGIRIAEAKRREAATGKLPIAQFSQSVIRSNNPVFVFGSLLEQGRFGASNFAVESLNHPNGLFNFRTLASVQIPLFDRNQTRSRIEQAKIGRDQTTLQAELVRQKIRFDVVRAYYGVILRREMVKLTTEAQRSAEANRKKAKDLVDVGMTTDADLFAAEVEVAETGQQRLEAESELATTTAELNLLIGERPGHQLDVAGDLQERYFPIDDQERLITAAIENRPDYKIAELSKKSSRERTRSVRDMRLPQVDAFGNVGYSSPYIANGSADYTVGVSLTYNLFDAGRKYREQQASEAETAADAELQVLANQITINVIRAFQNFKTAKAKIQVSIKSIDQASESLRIVQDRYKAGLTTFNEVIRSESALVRAKHNLLGARYEYYLAYASVLFTTGQLNDVRLFD